MLTVHVYNYWALDLIIHYFDQEEHVKGDDEDSDADLCLDENVAYGDRSNGHPGVATVIFCLSLHITPIYSF